MILAFLAKYAYPLKVAGVVLGIIAVLFLIARFWPADHTAEKQAEQTTASGNAIAGAAADAVTTLQDRAVTEQAVQNAVTATTKDIHDAQTVDAVHDAVLGSLCKQPAHSSDPACRMLQARP